MMQRPMAKHTGRPAVNFYEELLRVVKEYDADMVLLGAHVGCKSGSAVLGIVREVLRIRVSLILQFSSTWLIRELHLLQTYGNR
jgi:hypothetical protein